ncbi:hypothetical protein TNCV_3658621 [Trichonephila clavipes]|nr:hypothetical protein TNCV_3658621 [Trichonephila clavipes]
MLYDDNKATRIRKAMGEESLMHVKLAKTQNLQFRGEVWKAGCQLRHCSHHLTTVQNDRNRRKYPGLIGDSKLFKSAIPRFP